MFRSIFESTNLGAVFLISMAAVRILGSQK